MPPNSTSTDPDDAYGLAPKDPAAWVEALNLQMTIDGADAPRAITSARVYPCTERPIATYPDADLGHLEQSVAAAAEAFPDWAARSWQDRLALARPRSLRSFSPAAMSSGHCPVR